MATIIRRGATQPKMTKLEQRKRELGLYKYKPVTQAERAKVRAKAYVTPARKEIIKEEIAKEIEARGGRVIEEPEKPIEEKKEEEIEKVKPEKKPLEIKEKEPTGEVRPAKKPKGLYEKLSRKELELEQRAKREGILRRQLLGIGAFGIGFSKIWVGMGSAILHPVKTIKSTYYAVTHIPEVAEQYGKRLKERPSAAMGEMVGFVTAPKIISKAESYIVPRATGFARTIGKKKIPAKKIIPKEVLTGKKRFPEAPPKKHLKIFKKAPYKLPGAKEPVMYHAAPKPIKGKIITRGESEFPGLYGAPGVSPHFFKIKKPGEYVKIGLGLPGRPKVAAITPTKFIKGKKAKPGVAFVPGVKSEIEAVLPPGTELIKGKTPYYLKWRGIRVPIQEVKVAPSKVKSVKGIKTPKIKKAIDISKEYYLPKEYPSLTTESLILTGAMPFVSKLGKPEVEKSKIISKPSRVFRPSRVIEETFVEPISYPSPQRIIKRPSRKIVEEPRYPPVIEELKPISIKPSPIVEEPRYPPVIESKIYKPVIEPAPISDRSLIKKEPIIPPPVFAPPHEWGMPKIKKFKLPFTLRPQPRAYTASLFGISFKEPISPGRIGKFFTGLEIRPPVKRKKKRKKFFDFI